MNAKDPDAAHQEAAEESAGIETVLGLLAKHPDNPDVAARAIAAVSNMMGCAKDPVAVAEKASDNGAAELVSAAMASFKALPSVQQAAMGLLTNLLSDQRGGVAG